MKTLIEKMPLLQSTYAVLWRYVLDGHWIGEGYATEGAARRAAGIRAKQILKTQKDKPA